MVNANIRSLVSFPRERSTPCMRPYRVMIECNTRRAVSCPFVCIGAVCHRSRRRIFRSVLDTVLHLQHGPPMRFHHIPTVHHLAADLLLLLRLLTLLHLPRGLTIALLLQQTRSLRLVRARLVLAARSRWVLVFPQRLAPVSQEVLATVLRG